MNFNYVIFSRNKDFFKWLNLGTENTIMVTNLSEGIVLFLHCVIHHNSCRMVVTEQCRAAKGVSSPLDTFTLQILVTRKGCGRSNREPTRRAPPSACATLCNNTILQYIQQTINKIIKKIFLVQKGGR